MIDTAFLYFLLHFYMMLIMAGAPGFRHALILIKDTDKRGSRERCRVSR